ncbi:hypothetical protein ACFQHV_11660 [Promicromonospora thailandica]|uniref:Uncharacterized protein n=1 Tax=Promicromonospora thailandica TaxID=765201 RepID=A0A9X2JYF8_9MICO|nr:hypothetical protein [Promicromonospora thailandica]MCP2265039.1 hypothetical protein [Promicromonospora thailandica]BFF19907.1 hypothetical protein GCM10025730_34280 [Promicromonospora thailandica]
MGAMTLCLATSAAGMSELLAQIGDERVKWVEVFRDRLVVHPERMSDGADIAAQLGITTATDYPATRPGFTVWTGRWQELDMFVYSELRGAARTVRAWPS